MKPDSVLMVVWKWRPGGKQSSRLKHVCSIHLHIMRFDEVGYLYFIFRGVLVGVEKVNTSKIEWMWWH